MEGRDELLILDCGTGFRNLGNELDETKSSTKGRVFITHPHWDHLQGFPFFKPFYSGDNWFRMYLPPQGDIGCKEILQGHMSSTFFPVSIDMLEADIDCETFQVGMKNFDGYSVEYMWASHTVPTAMFKLHFGDTSVIFAPDNELVTDGSEGAAEFRKKLIEFFKDADVLIHDAQYDREQYKGRIGWGHSAWEDVVELAKEANVKKLFLTHHDPDNDDEKLAIREKKILDAHAQYFETLGLAKEGQKISLTYTDSKKFSAK
jgi:phosphoribosyl 1,2-cyclic phosphodiesterase